MRNYETRPLPELPYLQEILVPKPDLSRPESVMKSLKAYTELAYEFGEFDQMKAKYVKTPYNYADISPMQPITKYDGSYSYYTGSFFMDGDYGFLLGGKALDQVEIKPLVVGSFQTDNVNGGIIIKQLQGRLRKNPLSEGERMMLKSFRWECMLVNMIASWAAKTNIPSLTIQSAENHRWRNAAESYNGSPKQLQTRYNETAGYLGFKRNRRTGNYDLPLPQ